MKNVFFLSAVLASFSAFANVTLDLDFKEYSKKEVSHFRDSVKASLDETLKFPLPNSKQEIEITVSEKLPEQFMKIQSIKNPVTIILKFYEVAQAGRKLINSGIVVTNWGKTASMEKFQDEAGKQPLMTLKVTPKKI